MTPTDFNGDGYADLVVAAPGEDIGVVDAGAVHVLYGSPDGVKAIGNQFWVQGSDGMLGQAEKGDEIGPALAWGDFDGNGYSDLAIGNLYDDVDSIRDAGSVNVLYGSPTGLTATGNQLITLGDLGLGLVESEDDLLGGTISAGDVNDDGYDELVTDIRGLSVNGNEGAGGIAVVPGSAGGLIPESSTLWTQDSDGIPDQAEPFDRFGTALAMGDLDADGYADLAVGTSLEDIDEIGMRDAGMVQVLTGSATGLTADRIQTWTEDKLRGVTEAFSRFGFSLTIGDFDGDGIGDLAIDGLREDVEVPTGPGSDTAVDAGTVHLLYGTTEGLSKVGNIELILGQHGLPGIPETGDQLGYGMAVGQVGNGPEDDLIVGIPNKQVGGNTHAGEALAVYGSPTGITAAGAILLSQDTPGVKGHASDEDLFGHRLAIANYGRSCEEDVAVGVGDDKVQGLGRAGMVNVLYGSLSGLTVDGNQSWTQDSKGITDQMEAGDFFGDAVAAAGS
jgi:hypothetical protein